MVAAAVVGLVLLTGCGQASGWAGPAAAASPPGGAGAASVAEIPEVEPTCMADYPRYADAAELVARADVVIRGTATSSRDYDS